MGISPKIDRYGRVWVCSSRGSSWSGCAGVSPATVRVDYSGPLKLDHWEGGYLLRASQPQCPLRPGAVDLAGRPVAERLMRALLVVEPEVGRQARHQFRDEIIQ